MAESSKFKPDEVIILAHLKPGCDHTDAVETIRVIPKSGCSAYTITCGCGAYVNVAINSTKDSLESMNKVRRLLHDQY